MKLYDFMKTLSSKTNVIINTMGYKNFWTGTADEFTKNTMNDRDIGLISIKDNNVIVYLL